MAQGKYWLITDFNTTIDYDISCVCQQTADSFWKSKNIVYSKGQLEKCPTTSKLHWQFTVCFAKKVRPRTVKTTLGNGVGCFLTDSKKTLEYVCKDDTSEGRRWEWGTLPFKRNCKTDWDQVRDKAKAGELDDPCIPANIFVCHYASLKKIKMDYMQGEPVEKEVEVYVGSTGLGKSRKAWQEAGIDAYPKIPTTKFWDGYQGQSHVVIDEFTGQIEITHMLRWLDRYPVLVETKGSGTVLKARKIWITSNLSPEDWYSTAPKIQLDALMRRLKVTIFKEEWTPPCTNPLLLETQSTKTGSLLSQTCQEDLKESTALLSEDSDILKW